MTQKSFKAYKNMPVRCCVRKPRYWYVDKVIFPKDGAIYDNVLEPFEGFYDKTDSTYPILKIPEMKLWNNTYTNAGTYAYNTPYEVVENVVTGRNFGKVGSPSINISNIASGFSKSNYLSIDTSTTKPEKFEAVVCLTTPSSFNSSVKSAMILQSAKDSGFMLYFRTPYWTDGTANKLQLNVGGDGSGFPAFIITAKPLLMDTQYWIKVIWDGKVWSLLTSTNGEDYKLEGEIEYDYGTYSSTFTLGNGANWNYDNAFNGTINLFGTYIKQTIAENAESEYYVPVESAEYTKVGSPTINEGIVSGLTTSNYLKLPNFNFTTANQWSIKLKYKPTSLSTGQFLFSMARSGTMYGICFGIESGKAEFLIDKGYNNWQAVWSWNIDADVWQYIEVTYDSSVGYTAKHSLDDKEYTVVGTLADTEKVFINPLETIIGYLPTYSYATSWLGEIDLSECNIKIDYSDVWGVGARYYGDVVVCKGILGGSRNPTNSSLMHSLYKDDETGENELSIFYHDIPGKTWFGEVLVTAWFRFDSFRKRWKVLEGSTSVPEYYTDGKENLWVKLGNNARLIPYQPRYYTEVPTTSFFDYDVRITLEVITPSSFNCNKILARVGTPSSWFGCYASSGKLSVSSRIESSSGLSTNTHYWVRLGDKYDSSTGKWTHRVSYIKDNGYTRETLPDESQWTTKTLTDTTSWFNSMSSFGTLGDVRSDKNCWDGAINLSNCYVEFGAGGVGDGMTYQYLCNFADGDYVEPEPPQIELA